MRHIGRRTGFAGAGLLVFVVVVGACSRGGSHALDGAAPADRAGGAAVPAPVIGNAPHARAASAPGSGRVGSAGDLPLLEAKIRTADITVRVQGPAAVAAKADAAAAIAVGLGGEVDGDNRTAGRHASAVLTLRVPTDSMTDALSQLARLGTEVSQQTSTRDVTAQVADVTSRVASARAAIVTLRTLYSRAHKVSDVIAIESELAGREADLESLEAQQRALSARTATAAITLYLTSRPPAATPAAKTTHGFLGGLSRGWHDFTAAAGWLATALGAALPFLLLVLLLAVALRLLWPRLRPAGRAAPAPATGEPGQ